MQSDRPPSITKQRPQSIEKHLSQLSSSKDIFYEMTPYYELINSKEKITKTLEKIESAILNSLTHPTENR